MRTWRISLLALALALAVAAPISRQLLAAPPHAEHAGAPTDEPASSDRDVNAPFHWRTWFWVAAGAVLATGAGVGFYLWQRPATDPYQVAGTLGAVGR